MATKDTTTAALKVEELTYLEAITQAGDAVLKSITETQEQLLAAAKQAAENLPKAPEFTVPVVTPEIKVPTARELVEVNFRFADKFIANQKAFADKYFALSGV